MANKVIVEYDVLAQAIKEWAEAGFVAKVSGKGLSTEDFTTALKTKLEGIASGAEVNTLVGVQVNSVDVSIDGNRKVNIDLSDYVKKEDVVSAYIASGDISASGLVSSLLIASNLGKVYNLTDSLSITNSNVSLFKSASVGQVFPAGSNVAIIKDGNDYLFDVLAGFVDLSGYYTKSETNTLLGNKANASDLTAHTGNTDIHVTTQNKTDWNAKYDKPSGGIPKTDLASGVQGSLDLADSALQASDVDSSLSGSSENPVQNKVVKNALDGKANSSHTHVVADITDLQFATKSEVLAILNASS